MKANGVTIPEKDKRHTTTRHGRADGITNHGQERRELAVAVVAKRMTKEQREQVAAAVARHTRREKAHRAKRRAARIGAKNRVTKEKKEEINPGN